MWMKNEDELVDAVLKGDLRSFEILLNPYRRSLLNMAYRMTGDAELAKEICQEALIKIFRYLGKFKKGKSFKNWIYRITVNTTYDFMKKKKRDQEELMEIQRGSFVNSSDDPEEQLLSKEVKHKIETCLQTLSPREKSIFILRDARGFSINETSEILDCSTMSVRTHLSRARRKIREKFTDVHGKLEVLS